MAKSKKTSVRNENNNSRKFDSGSRKKTEPQPHNNDEGEKSSRKAKSVDKNHNNNTSRYDSVENYIHANDAIKLVFDICSQDEKKKQAAQQKKYKEEFNKIKRREKKRLSELEEEREQAENDYYEERQRLREQEQEEKKEANRPLYEQIRDASLEKQDFIEKKISDLKKLFSEQNESAKKESEHYNRCRSTRYILRKIEDHIYQWEAYLRYIETYRSRLENRFEKRGSVLKPFEEKLPLNYPYAGKIYYLRKSDFVEWNTEKGKTYSAVLFQFEDNYKVNASLARAEILEFEKLSDSETYPFMYTKATVDNNVFYYLSYRLGDIKDSIGKARGIKATVISLCKNTYKDIINLSYKNLRRTRFFLNKKDLIRNKKTPIGSNLLVFVKDYDNLLNNITVTEKFEESLVINYFDTVILSVTMEQLNELQYYVTLNNWQDDDDEWVFKPVGKKITNLTEIIISNKHYGIRAEFEDIGGNRLILVFRELIKDIAEIPGNKELFVSARIAIDVYDRNAIMQLPSNYHDYFNECLKLRIYLIDDFLTQKSRGQTDSEMGQFIDKWRNLTIKTIDSIKYQKSIHLTVTSRKSYENGGTVLFIEKNDDFERFYKYIEREYKQKSFYRMCCIKIGGYREDIPVKLCVDEHNEYFIRTRANVGKEQLENCGNEIELYEITDAMPLRRQLAELENFKVKRPANERVKDAVLDPESITYLDNGHRIDFFYNRSINDNKYQEEAVKKAFSAEHFFIIQGPPGTGKTTIIEELVIQYIKLNPLSRILIASQTNVAVDNVIKGLDNFINNTPLMGIKESQIVRCGNIESMMEEIKKYSFQSRFEDYERQFKTKNPDNPMINELRKEWGKLLKDSDTSTVAMNYFIRNFNIIGATCVGLANGKFGLQDVDFDLVIIDEAGKALPGEAIIPINKAKKLILIGDHKQLPPYIDPRITSYENIEIEDIISHEERDYFFKQSFFERIFTKCPEDSKAMLKIQFRMPPVIAGLVNKFYDDALESGISCNDKKPLLLDSHLIFVDMVDVRKYREEYSHNKYLPKNLFEPEVVECIVMKIREIYFGRIVVITPYKGQKYLINEKLGNRYGHVVVDTIDAFQGDEEQIVIYCMTRSIRRTKYFSDDARLNVAFSRSKNTLIMIGSSKYLSGYSEDKKVRQSYEYIKENGRCISYDEMKDPSFEFKNTKE